MDDNIHRILIELGWLIPVTEEQVRWAEEAREQIALPPDFPTAEETWARGVREGLLP